MKTFILLLLFAFFGLNTLTAQNHSEVYNSVYDRYDFINSSGNLIGYKIWNSIYDRWDYKDSNGNLYGYQKYNTIYKRWDYTDLRKQNNQNNQPQKVGRYNVHDYGEVKSNFNTNLAVQALQARQAAYDRNSKLLNEEYHRLYHSLSKYNTEFKRTKSVEIFSRKVDNYFKNEGRKTDLSLPSVFAMVMNNIRVFYNQTIEEVNNLEDTSTADYYYKEAVEDFKKRWVISAKYNYEKALSINPNHYNSLLGLAEFTLWDRNKIMDEMNSLGTTLKENKRYNGLLLELRILNNEALPFYKRAFQINPNSKIVENNISIIEKFLKEKKERKEDKNSANYYFRIGFESNEKGLIDEAIANYKKALIIDPNHSEALTNIGLLFLKNQRDFNKKINNSPNNKREELERVRMKTLKVELPYLRYALKNDDYFNIHKKTIEYMEEKLAEYIKKYEN